MESPSKLLTAARESVSTIFRHILPGIIVICVGSLSVPSFFERVGMKAASSVVVLGAVALAVGNAWHVFHRYFFLQAVDLIAYCAGWKGEPRRTSGLRYREDVAEHVTRFFRALPEARAMGRHIRDRFSSFNFMYIVSQSLIVFAVVAEDDSCLREHSLAAIIAGIVGLFAATWQYSIVRVIDERFGWLEPDRTQSGNGSMEGHADDDTRQLNRDEPRE